MLGEIEAELEPGERLIWTGHPVAAAVHRKLRWLYWIAAPMVATAAVFARGSLVAQAVLVAGIALLLGPTVAASRARCTVYALTDRRALVISKSIGHRASTSVALSRADGTVEVLPLAGDIGTVLFVPGLSPRVRYTDHTGKFGFWDVRNAAGVADIVRKQVDRMHRR